jgi:hypothetical protein
MAGARSHGRTLEDVLEIMVMVRIEPTNGITSATAISRLFPPGCELISECLAFRGWLVGDPGFLQDAPIPRYFRLRPIVAMLNVALCSERLLPFSRKQLICC